MSNARELAELSGSYGTGGFVGMKNRIINGAMMIDQRGSASTPVVSSTTASVYSVDRFLCRTSNSSSQITLTQDTSAPVGFVKSLKAQITTTGSPTYSGVSQRIEGLNASDFGWGTANAVPAVFSFWVKSSVAGQYSVFAFDNGATLSIACAYTINSANTWEYKTVSIPAPTSGNFPTDTSYSFAIGFTLGSSNASYIGAGNTWVAGTQRVAVTGSVDLNQTLNATFYITGVQLEKGSTATSFDYRPYGTELALCQRYFITYGGVDASEQFCMGMANSSTACLSIMGLPVEMRTTPTLGYNSASGFRVNDVSVQNQTSALALSISGPKNVYLNATTTGLTAGRPTRFMAFDTNTRLTFSAEL